MSKAAPIDAEALAERLLRRSVVTEEGCRRWTGSHKDDGYCRIKVGGKTYQVHRLAHEIWIGPIPDGYEVDHVHARGCRHRDCIEPSHLEAVTHAENVRRQLALITHCSKGHELTPDNIKSSMKRGYPYRRCRRCANDAQHVRDLARRGPRQRKPRSGG